MAKVLKTIEVSQKDTVRVTAEMTTEEILAFDKEGVQLQFSADTLSELAEGDVRQLSHENARDYFMALGEKRARTKALETGPSTGRVEYVRSPFDGVSFNRFKTVPRPGMHTYWADPREIENRKALGYRVVEDPAAAPNADHQGGTNRLLTDDGKVDLVQMEVPEKLYQQHIRGMSDQSRARLEVANTDEVKESIEIANNRRRGKRGGIRLVDESSREPS